LIAIRAKRVDHARCDHVKIDQRQKSLQNLLRTQILAIRTIKPCARPNTIVAVIFI